jgi:hypothetical protein
MDSLMRREVWRSTSMDGWMSSARRRPLQLMSIGSREDSSLYDHGARVGRERFFFVAAVDKLPRPTLPLLGVGKAQVPRAVEAKVMVYSPQEAVVVPPVVSR